MVSYPPPPPPPLFFSLSRVLSNPFRFEPFLALPACGAGPVMLIDDISTIVVEPGCTAHITASRDVRIELGQRQQQHVSSDTECDPIQLAIFSHRWVGLCVVGGRTHQCRFGPCHEVHPETSSSSET